MMDVSKTPWIAQGKWSTSRHNWVKEIREKWSLPPKVIIHDVTLRDGEQTPGVVFRMEEKLKIAHALADAGIQRIEGGMPAVSPEDAEAISQMVKEIKSAEIVGFCRARKDDVDLSLKCKVKRLIIELAARDQEINSVFGSREKAAKSLLEVVKYAKDKGADVTLFLMESSRAELDLLQSLIIPSVEEGKADSVALVDTRGCCLPEAVVFLVKKFKEWVKVPIEVHFHDVWGLAVANTLAAVTAGAEVVHTCINGLGGNAALDECVMGLEGLVGVPTGVETKKLLGLSKMGMQFSGANWYKPFVGQGVSDVEAGIPVKSMWEHRNEPGMGREFLNYEVVGGKSATPVLGKKSGRYSVLLKAVELNLPLPSEEQSNEMLSHVKTLSISKKRLVTDEEFQEIYKKVMKT
jgi:methanogen homocitrate synthase